MTDIQAALGLSQMQRLDMFVEQRHAVANKYTDLLDKMPIKTPYQSAESYSSYHLYILQIDSALNDHLEFFKAMRSNGVGVNLHYIPIYRQPYYEKIGFSSSDYPEAEKYYSQAVSLPIFPGLTDVQQKNIVLTIGKAISSSRI
jgi:dTDP-4-amino-4,6-dideoxygalactose transaminase